MRWMGVCFVAWLFSCANAVAFETVLTPRLSAGVEYTDNVFLAPRTPRKITFIQSPRDDLGLARKARRAEARL